MKYMVGVPCASLTLTRSHRPSGPAAGPAIPTSNSYSKKTQSNNAENKRPEEDRESGRKASSTAKVPASPLPGLERKKTTPTPSTVSHAPAPLLASPALPPASAAHRSPGASTASPRRWEPSLLHESMEKDEHCRICLPREVRTCPPRTAGACHEGADPEKRRHTPVRR